MPLTNRTFLGGAVLLLSAGLLVLVGIVATAIVLATQTSRVGTEVLQARSDRLVTESVLRSLLNLETGQRGYLLTGNARYLRPFDLARGRLPQELRQLSAAAGRLGFSRQQVAILTTTINDKLVELRQSVALAHAGHRDEAIAMVRSNRGLALMENARGQLAVLLEAAEQRVTRDVKATTASAERLRLVTEGGGALIVLFGLGALFLAIQYTRELHRARTEVEQLNAGLEERVAERTISLSRANEEIQRFAYIVSHDLRAPLVNIMGFTSELEVGLGTLRQYMVAEAPDHTLVLQARDAVDEDFPEAVRFIRSSTAKMDNLIKAILQLSREGRRTLTAETVDIGKLVANAAASLKHQADEVGARIEVKGPLPIVISDRLALEQILGNLLDNALKYLAPGRRGDIVVSAREEGSRVIVSVRDNGRGIAEQDLERVFDLFRRAGTQDKPGEGIGLAHVRTLARRLGGEVTLSSQLGAGSDFRLELPRLSLSPMDAVP